VNPRALTDFKHLLCHLDVQGLRHTHGEISKRFRHGQHRGQLVDGLAQKLRGGEVQAADITPLVVIQWGRELWVVCGNRRLKALKDFALQAPQGAPPVRVRCILHKHIANIPGPLIAKFILAWSTTNAGVTASFFQNSMGFGKGGSPHAADAGLDGPTDLPLQHKERAWRPKQEGAHEGTHEGAGHPAERLISAETESKIGMEARATGKGLCKSDGAHEGAGKGLDKSDELYVRYSCLWAEIF